MHTHTSLHPRILEHCAGDALAAALAMEPGPKLLQGPTGSPLSASRLTIIAFPTMNGLPVAAPPPAATNKA
jgi:hypothetical protein